MSTEQLVIKNLSHKYSSQEADNYILNSINLTLKRGELVGLVGPSGCGKTTLLRLIAGFESPAEGSIFLEGREISNKNRILPPEKRGIGMVFQDYALFPHLDAWKNVCFGLSSKSQIERTKWLLELLGLSKFVDRYPHQLSGGQRQRLALARALAPGNSVILLDEPFNSLDVQVRTRLRTELPAVLKTVSATGIFVTHDSQEAISVCDRVAVMEAGVLHQCDSAQELISNPSSSFVGEFLFQKNILPVNFSNNIISTPLGNFSFPEISFEKSPELIMFGSEALKLDFSSNFNSIVKAREYQDSHWLITVKYNEFLLRVTHPLTESISIGQPSRLTFNTSPNVFLFPDGNQVNMNTVDANQ